MTHIRLSDLTLRTICRIGVTINTCFWMPASLLLGIAGATGTLPMQGSPRGAQGAVGFVVGLLQGIGCSIIMDVILILGALGLAIAQRGWGGGNFALKLRKAYQPG